MTAYQRRHRLVQGVRRFVQLGAMLLVVTLILLGLYYHYHASRSLDRVASIPGWRGHALAVIQEGMEEVDDPEEFLENFNGNLWSMRIGGLDIADPLAFVEVAAATWAIQVPLFLAVLIPVVLTLVLGRVFCSWVCPGYVLFEVAGKLRKVLRHVGLEPAEIAFSPRNKYVLLGVGLVMAAATGLPIFSLFYPPVLLSRTAHALIFGTGVTGMVTILCALVAVEVFVSPRWWCRSMCPGGGLYGLVGSVRALRVELVPGLCTNCGVCEPVCESGLDPMRESRGIECDNCGACIRYCPEDALNFRLGLPGSLGRIRGERGQGAGSEAA